MKLALLILGLVLAGVVGFVVALIWMYVKQAERMNG